MTDLKEQLDRALTVFEPSGHALERTMELVQSRRRRHRVRGQSLSALVVVLALLAILIQSSVTVAPSLNPGRYRVSRLRNGNRCRQT